ncbi:hypothetical protein AB1399_07675 [Hydrogenibacillus schlegelii]|uniref:Mobile element protein n=1 Tax=Hydrogenibacillus schlegelii TaxID=1484 RepID=A0A179IM92_HYDSH|nr:hypothetical protein SA87_00155 [Hydrogenibacillus schlegelii]PTQ51803.1 MAG: Mobile element protein [Hydrogenibacillus schlegelii]
MGTDQRRKTLVERSRESGVHPHPFLKGKLPLLEKGAERSPSRTKSGSPKRIRNWVELLGKKEGEIARLKLLALRSGVSSASLEAKRVEALNALLTERIWDYNERRPHSSLRPKTSQETLKEALSTS